MNLFVPFKVCSAIDTASAFKKLMCPLHLSNLKSLDFQMVGWNFKNFLRILTISRGPGGWVLGLAWCSKMIKKNP